MLKHILGLTALLIVPSLAAAQPVPLTRPPATYCPALVFQDYQFGVTYYAKLYRDPSCRPQDVTRVRKTSTLSTRAGGAAYQPIRPETGAWEVTADGDTIPNDAQWTLYNWRWEYYDGLHWLKAVVK